MRVAAVDNDRCTLLWGDHALWAHLTESIKANVFEDKLTDRCLHHVRHHWWHCQTQRTDAGVKLSNFGERFSPNGSLQILVVQKPASKWLLNDHL